MTNELEKREKQEVGTTAAERLQTSGPAFSPDVDIYLSDDEAAVWWLQFAYIEH